MSHDLNQSGGGQVVRILENLLIEINFNSIEIGGLVFVQMFTTE